MFGCYTTSICLPIRKSARCEDIGARVNEVLEKFSPLLLKQGPVSRKDEGKPLSCMASDRRRIRYSDFMALETLLRSKLLFEGWSVVLGRRFHVFESPYPSLHRTVFFGAPLAFLRGVAMGLCRRCESLRHLYVFVSSSCIL